MNAAKVLVCRQGDKLYTHMHALLCEKYAIVLTLNEHLNVGDWILIDGTTQWFSSTYCLDV